MKRSVLSELFVSGRFFWSSLLVTGVMGLSYAFPTLLPVAFGSLVLLAMLVLMDVAKLFHPSVEIVGTRVHSPLLSLGDENPIELTISSRSSQYFSADIIDELPEQFQLRNQVHRISLKGNATVTIRYSLRPLTRGLYGFGDVHIYISSPLGLMTRRITTPAQNAVAVYPSIIQLRRFELKNIKKIANEFGFKKVRRLGHSYEFEQIKTYVRGDDYRSINWKATGRRSQLMVNQYEDEKSQQVYSVIDKSRVMHMPFGGMSLFDYAVNASLVLTNIALAKQDKAGLLTFAEMPKTLVRAERKRAQLRLIMEALYKEEEEELESNYERLYLSVRKLVSGRSLLFLYTNFESSYSLQRVLPQLRKLNQLHLLVVVFFENTELIPGPMSVSTTLEDIYREATAEHFILTKHQIVQELKQHGIMAILTRPEHLTISSINKYLELKSRGLI